MLSSLMDWTIYKHVFVSDEMRHIFCEDTAIARWLAVEIAITEAQGELGIIPAASAQAIVSAATSLDIDKVQLATDMMLAGRPIIGLSQQLKACVGPEYEDWVHWGVTTQDIMDTGMILQIREGLAHLHSQTESLLECLKKLASAHRNTAMMGRTNGQYAQPMSVALKLSVWIEELTRRLEALNQAAARGLMVQFGGAVGNLAAFGDNGPALRTAVARRLELAAPIVHWQNARDGIADILGAVGILCAGLEKIAHEVNTLAGDDIGEMYESHVPGRGASSAMTHKRNQRASEFAEAASRLGRQRAQVAPELMRHEHERSGGVWIAEWVTVPEVFLYASGALKWSNTLFEALHINPDKMLENIAASNGLVFSEGATLALAVKLGRREAKRLVTKACDRVRSEGITLQQALHRVPELRGIVTEEEIGSLFHLDKCLGSLGHDQQVPKSPQ